MAEPKFGSAFSFAFRFLSYCVVILHPPSLRLGWILFLEYRYDVGEFLFLDDEPDDCESADADRRYRCDDNRNHGTRVKFFGMSSGITGGFTVGVSGVSVSPPSGVVVPSSGFSVSPLSGVSTTPFVKVMFTLTSAYSSPITPPRTSLAHRHKSCNSITESH